jgi:predicted DCC family thiol-disulfide oxidoreductase YuxK
VTSARPQSQPRSLVLFDAECGLCNSLVTWIAKRDTQDAFRFASLQGPLGQKWVGGQLSTLVFFETIPKENSQAIFVTKTDAVFGVCAKLPAPWRWLSCLRVVPRPLRDGAYRGIARTRYAFFGQHNGTRHAEVKRRMI